MASDAATRTIVLVRHGRSRHAVTGLLDRAAFLQWREAYEAAGVDPADLPPPGVCAMAQRAHVLVSSDARRAIESAHALAPDCEVVTSPLLRELSLQPPRLSRIRLPLMGWALSFALRWIVGGHATPEEKESARAAAEWLLGLSMRDGDVIAVTHASFRMLLATELMRRGWISSTSRGSDHWSAWLFSAPARNQPANSFPPTTH